MLDYFLGFLGGGYILGRTAFERFRDASDDCKRASWELYVMDFYATPQEEMEVETFIQRNPERKIKKRIRENLIDVYGEDYMNLFHLPQRGYSRNFYRGDSRNPTGNDYWAKQLILSKMGKVCKGDFILGYPIGTGGLVEGSRTHNINMAHQIEKNLNAAGFDVHFVLDSYPTPTVATPIQQCCSEFKAKLWD